MAAERRADARRQHIRVALDEAAGERQLRAQLGEGERALIAVVVGRAAHYTVLAVADGVAVDLPDGGGALLELAADVHRRLVDRPAGGERRPAAAGDVREADRVGVDDAGVHVVVGDAECLGQLHRQRGALPADVDRPEHEAHVAVGADQRVGTGLETGVAPVAHRDATAAVLAGELGAVVRGLLGGLHDLLGANAAVLDTVGAPHALSRGVLEPQLHLIHLQALGQLGHERLHRERALRRAGGAVGRDLRLVRDDVVGVRALVGDVVGAEHAARTCGDW